MKSVEELLRSILNELGGDSTQGISANVFVFLAVALADDLDVRIPGNEPKAGEIPDSKNDAPAVD